MIRRKVRPLYLVLSLCIVAAVGVVGMNRASAAPSISNATGSPVAGTSILVTWSGIGSPTALDWIGLYASNGAAGTAFLSFQYTNAFPATSGNERFLLPYGTPAGSNYQLRLFSNNGFTELARSSSFPITASNFSLGRGPTSVANGNSLRVFWSGIPAASPTDWVGLYASSAATDDAFITYEYTNSTDGGVAGMPFFIPSGTAPGTTYEFRMFSDNGFTKIGAPSAPFTVT